MMRIVLLLACFALANGAEIIKSRRPIKGQYIVVFKDDQDVDTLMASNELASIQQTVIRTFSHDILNGYSAKLTKEARDILANDSRVAFIEQDSVMKIAQGIYQCKGKQAVTEYFLPRVSQKTSSDNLYKYMPAGGENVNAYVLDTGIFYYHNEYKGRVFRGPSFVQGESLDDYNGHGTCCAGILAGQLYGAAKKANVIGVKVLSNSGSGATSGIIAGINYVIHDNRPGKKLISMSLGGGNSPALNNAVASAVKANIPVFAAAGNNYGPVAMISPANEPTAITIAASDEGNNFARFSNWGPEVDLIAPGVQIKCASPAGPNSFVYLTGTSMATPLAAGVGAVIMSATNIDKPADLDAELKKIAINNAVKGHLRGTPNRLLYNGCM